MNDNYSEKAELLAKYLAEECTVSEKQQVEEWLRADPRHQQEFDRLKQVWEQSAEDYSQALPDSAALWMRLQTSMRKEQPFTVVHQSDGSRRTLQWAWQIAASVLLVLGLGLGVNHWQQPDTITQLTQTQEKKELTLPDGTKVWLNAGSKLSYPEIFGENERKVKLEGEAFFEVVHLERDQPFIIAAGKTETTVLGTSFNVHAYSKQGVRVTVITGKVALVSNREPIQRVVLTKGFTGLFDPATQEVKREVTKDLNAIAWKTKVLTFSKTPLHQVIADIARYYHREVRLENASLASCRFTGRFDNQSFDQVIRTLSLTFNAAINNQNQVILLQAGQCQ
jgi:ferric-dicitrate binding protein FerR (iron transport regulator)